MTIPEPALTVLLDQVVTGVEAWQAGVGARTKHPSVRIDPAAITRALDELVHRLHDNYPFFHPRYAGQMLKPPHPVAIAGYLAAMQINPNAHALDGGPATARLEREGVAELATMFGYREHLGHLTSSGTIANLEALYVARATHPGLGIAHGEQAHYTHGRMAGVLGIEAIAVPADRAGRMDVDALRDVLRTGRVGTVVATAGSTGLGAVDPVPQIVPLARGFRGRGH